jgi:DNA-binding GntR family transcriptional regulator
LWYTTLKYEGRLLERENLAAVAYKKIKGGILSLQMPPGGILQERGLAEALGMSRTPVREAIHRLSHEGWLKVNSRKNVRVREVTPPDLLKIFQARRILELGAIDLAFSAGFAGKAAERMAVMDTEMHRSGQSLFEFITSDQSFHSALFAAIDNQVLKGLWKVLSEEMIWLGMLAMDENRFDDVLREHGKILQALEQGRKMAARKAMVEHLEKTEDVLLKKFNSVL